MQYIFDAHSHIQFPLYNHNREEVIKRAQKAHIRMVAVGTNASTSEAAIALAHAYSDDVWATVGFHPNHVVAHADGGVNWHHGKKEQASAQPEKFDIQRLRTLAEDPKVVAIGECGLDYYRIMNNELGIKESQKNVFLQQIQLAQELQKPLMIHCRPQKGTDDAYENLLDILKNTKHATPIIHFYVGSPAITKKLVDAGCAFTFGGVITFSRDYDESINIIPIDRLLVETDCPYVAPLAYRGQQNEPSLIVETVKKLAELKGISFDNIVEQFYNNTSQILHIKNLSQ
ncbi:MAG: TatD family hydrolase [bacterium]|nr:TatD family hydrolase [bacterium]